MQMERPWCGVIATDRDRRRHVLHQIPGATQVQIVWRQRIRRCDDDRCARKTLWRAVGPELVRIATNQSRFDDLTTRGVNEHTWHHLDLRKHGATELSGMVDLTRNKHRKARVQQLKRALVRSGKAYATWLNKHTKAENPTKEQHSYLAAAIAPATG